MAKKTYAASLDLSQNELLNALLQNLTTPPTSPKKGQIYYNSSAGENTVYVWTGAVWLDLGNIYQHPSYTALNPTLTGANVLASISVDNEGHVDAATTRILTLGDLGFTGDSDANNYIHPTFSGNDLGAALSGATVISDVNVNNEGHVTSFVTRDMTPADIGAAVINDSVTNAINTWSSNKIQSELDAINSTISGALVYQTAYNASTNSPNLDSAPTGIKQGYTYAVSVAGDFYTEGVQPGDMLIAEVDNPSTLADWSVINKNIPDIVDATTNDKGIIKLATQAMVDAGTDNTTAVTPLTLAQRLNAVQSSNRYSQTIGDGTSTSITVTHNFGTKDVVIRLREVSTGKEIVCEDSAPTDNTVGLVFNTAPTTNQYRVTILK